MALGLAGPDGSGPGSQQHPASTRRAETSGDRAGPAACRSRRCKSPPGWRRPRPCRPSRPSWSSGPQRLVILMTSGRCMRPASGRSAPTGRPRPATSGPPRACAGQPGGGQRSRVSPACLGQIPGGSPILPAGHRARQGLRLGVFESRRRHQAGGRPGPGYRPLRAGDRTRSATGDVPLRPGHGPPRPRPKAPRRPSASPSRSMTRSPWPTTTWDTS